MASVNFNFNPAVGFTGNFSVVAYDNTRRNVPLGQVNITGPVGSTVSGTITGLPALAAYRVKVFTSDCPDSVGEITLNS